MSTLSDARQLRNLTGDKLLKQIRRYHQKKLFISAGFLLLFAGATAFLTWRIGCAGLAGLLPCLCCACLAGYRLLNLLHPEKSLLFRKYGTPDTVAEMIAADAADIFFENRKMIVSQHFLLKKDNPESLMRFEWILLAYIRHSGAAPLPRGIFLAAHDCWGSRQFYPFAVGEQQIFKPEILLDKIKKNAPGVQIGSSAEHFAYAKSHRRKLPEAPQSGKRNIE